MSVEFPECYEAPNPAYGLLLPTDYFVLFYTVVRLMLWELPLYLISYRYLYDGHESPTFTTNLKNFVLRRTNTLLNWRCLRFLIRPDEFAILDALRYVEHRHNLYQLVSRPTFTGYWILQFSFVEIRPPRTSDIVILYFHGGGYITSQPATYLLFLLRLAESLIKQGLSVSIFALDYRLAPEHAFPKQLQDATAAYSYLLDEMHIIADKIFVAGDSAGGHLALSFLVNLGEPLADPKSQPRISTLIKPGGLILLSPWLSMYHEPSSYRRNEHYDIITAPFLRAIAKYFLVPQSGYTKSSRYLEFLKPSSAIDWYDVLPPWTWVSAGEREIFVDNIVAWANDVKDQLGPECIELEIGKGEVHDWQWLETVDTEKVRKFLRSEGGDRSFNSIDDIGKAIGQRLLKSR